MHAVKKWAGRVLFLFSLLIVGRLFYSHLAGFDWMKVRLNSGRLALALLCNLVYVGLYARLWRGLAERSGLNLPAKTATGISFCALAYKYLPVRVAGIGYRAWSYRRLGGWPIARVTAVLYVESALVLFSGSSVVLATTHWVHWPKAWIGPVLMIPFGTAMLGLWLLPKMLERVTRHWPKWQWVGQAASVAWDSMALGPLLQYVGAWAVLGSGLWLTVSALGVPLTAISWAYCLWAYVVSGLAGMVALFAPAGLGVREGALTIALGTMLAPAEAAVAALFARVLILAAEAVCAGYGFWIMQKLPPTLSQKHSRYNATESP